MFTLFYALLLVAYQIYKDNCEGHQLLIDTDGFASTLRVLIGFHWLFILVTFIISVCACCNRESEPIHDADLA